MPRKRKQGERTPSRRLNDTVNQLSDGEFEDVVAILGSGKRRRVFLELIVWHRGKQPYDPDVEIEAYKEFDINSLRDVALRHLGKALIDLREGLPAELQIIAESLKTAPKARLLQAMAEIATAKAHAIKRCYLERLVRLIALERDVSPIILTGKQLETDLKRIEVEMDQANANILLAKEIAFFRSEYLEKVNAHRIKTGELDSKIISEYLDSDFAKLSVVGYPPLLLSEKLLLDEVFKGLSGKVNEACRIAEMVCELDLKSPFLSPPSRAKLLVRLYDYYSALGDRSKGENLISLFRAIKPEMPENRDIFLIRFLVILLDWAIDRDDDVAHKTAKDFFERNEDFVLSSPVGGYRSRILIVMMVIYLGEHEGEKAKHLFDHLYRDKEQKPPLLYRISFLICHLMILYDLKEVDAIKQHAKNYREFMLEKGEIAMPAIDLLLFLRKQAKRYAATRLKAKEVTTYNSALDKVTTVLRSHQRADVVTNRLSYGPLLSWLAAKRI